MNPLDPLARPEPSAGIRRPAGWPRIARLLAALLAPTLAHANEYWDEFGDDPVPIQQQRNGSAQTLELVEYQDGMLVAELDGGVGEISLPVSESMVRDLRLDLSALSEVNRLVEQENYERALERMRPVVYPLVKFAPLPENFTQLHVAIRRLIETLILAGNYAEAEDLISRIDLGESGLKYSKVAIRLMNAYLGSDRFEAAARLAQALPVEGRYAENIRPVLDAADALRGAGNYDAVIPLYRAIEDAVSAEVRGNVRLWLAYSLVLADRLDEARPMIDSLEEPEMKDPLFSLYKLLHGSLAYRQDEFGKALDILTRGFVRAQTSYQWVPEMLFMIGDCYARSEDLVAARNVWTEIAILYPQSPWAQRAETSLGELPAEIREAD